MSDDVQPPGGGYSDGFAVGYSAAKRFYDLDRTLITKSAAAWQDPHQERARSVIRQVWPALAASLDRIVERAPDLR